MCVERNEGNGLACWDSGAFASTRQTEIQERAICQYGAFQAEGKQGVAISFDNRSAFHDLTYNT